MSINLYTVYGLLFTDRRPGETSPGWWLSEEIQENGGGGGHSCPERQRWVCSLSWRPGQVALPTLGGVWPEHPKPLPADLSSPAQVTTHPPPGIKGTNLSGEVPLWPPGKTQLEGQAQPSPPGPQPASCSMAAKALEVYKLHKLPLLWNWPSFQEMLGPCRTPSPRAPGG